MFDIEKTLLEYTKLARELSELPANAESAEAYAPILDRKNQIRARLGELRQLIDGYTDTINRTPEPEIPTMITIKEASSRTGLSYDYIRKLCLRGKIIYIKAGSKFLINLDKLVEFLNTGEKL